MKHRIAGIIGIWLVFIGLGTGLARAAETQVSLLLDKTEAIAGGSVLAGVRFQLKEDWHTYWRYGGDAAQPPSITWKLPEGVTAGEIRWPLPHKEETSGLYSYAYHDEVVLLVPLTLNSDLKTGPVTLNADIFWLECKESCVPRDGKISANLTIGTQDKTSTDAPTLARMEQ
jgi:DsbC/DsbD-like thiol-disulfide interchange protein